MNKASLNTFLKKFIACDYGSINNGYLAEEFIINAF